jgi:hypothetical protein
MAEDPETEYLKSQVIEAARAAGIVIFGIGYPNDRKPLEIGRLERLAQETNGPFVKTGPDRRMPGAFLDAFFGHMEYGGSAKFPLRVPADRSAPVSFELSTALTSGTTLSKPVTLAERVTPGWWDWILAQWYSTTWQMRAIYLGLAAALLAGAGLALWAFRRSTPSGEGPITRGELIDDDFTKEAAETRWTGGGGLGDTYRPTSTGATYAWLERLDTGERLGISKTTASVGRHDDNDVRISDESVHRRHANIHMTPHREFILTDLAPSSGNVVKVNGATIGKEQRILRDGDILEMGRVRMRFEMSTV